MAGKGGSGGPRKRRRPSKDVQEGSAEEVLQADIQNLLVQHSSRAVPDGGESADSKEADPLPERYSEVEVSISVLSSTGDGLGLSEDGKHVYVVPFAVPGDIVKAKVVFQRPAEQYTVTDFLEVVNASPLRDDKRIQCQYFARCSGCQFQMLSYEEQLAHKKTVVERAYRNFSNISPELIPDIGDTVASPKQYGYRTKLTPHFDGPPGHRRKGSASSRPTFTEVPPIGFNLKNQRKVLDVEDCPIATLTLREGLKEERKRVSRELERYRKGATLLLRESCSRPSDNLHERTGNDKEATRKEDRNSAPVEDNMSIQVNRDAETKTCITDNNATAMEYVDNYLFYNVAGAFFQNNNSILPQVVAYIRENILAPSAHEVNSDTTDSATPDINTLLDAYCGSGLFTITLSALFKRSIGIDISDLSIASARKNAKVNNTKNTRFIAATASQIFADLDVEPDATAVVIDPPRKGCDNDFLKQLLAFAPKRIIYVSCNVHTQARDVGILVEGQENKIGARSHYRIESIRGFDFFPQSAHVECIAVLGRVDQSQG